MKCPRCGTENQEDARYCYKCGQPRYEVEINTDKKPLNQTQIVNSNTPMTFHMIYAIYLLVAAIIGLTSSIVWLFSEETVISGCINLIPNAVLLTMAILLLTRNKVGNIIRLVYNIYQIVMNSIASLVLFTCELFLMILAIIFIATAETEAFCIVLFVFALCVVVTILAIGGIIFNALVINYYRKRKHMFN